MSEVPTKTESAGAGETDRAALVTKIAAGDPAALISLYDETCGIVFGLLLSILEDRTLAEETLLDVYTQVWQNAGEIELQKVEGLTWLTRLARSRAIGQGRPGTPGDEAAESTGWSLSGDPASRQSRNGTMEMRREPLEITLAALGPERGRALKLAYFHGLNYYEIASLLGRTSAEVRAELKEVMKYLNDSMRSQAK